MRPTACRRLQPSMSSATATGRALNSCPVARGAEIPHAAIASSVSPLPLRRGSLPSTGTSNWPQGRRRPFAPRGRVRALRRARSRRRARRIAARAKSAGWPYGRGLEDRATMRPARQSQRSFVGMPAGRIAPAVRIGRGMDGMAARIACPSRDWQTRRSGRAPRTPPFQVVRSIGANVTTIGGGRVAAAQRSASLASRDACPRVGRPRAISRCVRNAGRCLTTVGRCGLAGLCVECRRTPGIRLDELMHGLGQHEIREASGTTAPVLATSAFFGGERWPVAGQRDERVAGGGLSSAFSTRSRVAEHRQQCEAVDDWPPRQLRAACARSPRVVS